MNTAQRLRQLREDSKRTQKEIAEYAKINVRTYQKYENGEREIKIEVLKSLAKLYNVTTDYILCIQE